MQTLQKTRTIFKVVVRNLETSERYYEAETDETDEVHNLLRQGAKVITDLGLRYSNDAYESLLFWQEYSIENLLKGGKEDIVAECFMTDVGEVEISLDRS